MGAKMTVENIRKQGGVAAQESVGKVFVVISDGTRKCLVCNQLFARQESFEHSKVTCHPERKRSLKIYG
jgi:hypothetical protein